MDSHQGMDTVVCIVLICQSTHLEKANTDRIFIELSSELWDRFFDVPLFLIFLFSLKMVELSFPIVIFSTRAILIYLHF